MLLAVTSCGSRTDLPSGSTLGDRFSSPEGGVSSTSRVVLFGGLGDDNSYRNDTWMFDGASWSPVAVSQPPPERDAATMAALTTGGRSELVLFGGVGTGGLLDDTWIFDGESWSEVHPGARPPARFMASMASLGDRVILFGGAGSNVGVLGDTWIFDGTTWSAVAAAGPAPRVLASMATLGNEVVLFGGATKDDTPLDDTWEFDGTAWSPVRVPRAPPGRSAAASATLGASILLFGGIGNSGNVGAVLPDTWAFDGARWTAVNVLAPVPNPDLIATTSFEGHIVGLENEDGTSPDTTWIFDGARWSAVGGGDPFAARASAMMALLP